MNKDEITKAAKEKLLTIWHMFQKAGFWILLILMLGFRFGVLYAETQIEREVHKAISLGNFLYVATDAKGLKVEKKYDVIERVAQ